MKRYIEELVKTRCFAQLLSLSIFPNAKEITESMGTYNALRTHLCDWKMNDKSIACVVVGDGTTPRTAALIAMRSAWTLYSIDPRLHHDGKHKSIERLFQFCGPVERFNLEADRVLIVAVHSHAPIRPVLNNIIGKLCRAMIAIPCCNFDTLPYTQPDVEYSDENIWSKANTVKIWKAL